MELAWSESGSGPTVVLVHGVCHRRHAWNPVAALLAERFRVVTVDLPGHGDSPPVPDSGDPLRSSLDGLEDFLGRRIPECERGHLVGNSLGGWAALELGARGLAASVTAVSPAGFFRSPADQKHAVDKFRLLRAVARPALPLVPSLTRSAAGRALLMSAFCSRPWRYPGELMGVDVPALVHNEVVDRGLHADFTYSAPVDEELPVTVLWGTWDLILPVGQSRLVPRVFPQAEVVRAPRLGHVPMTDDPRLVADTIAATVDRALRL